MTINTLFTYSLIGAVVLVGASITTFLYLTKKEQTQKIMLLKSLSAWSSLLFILSFVTIGAYYQFGYNYKKSELPISYLMKDKTGFPKDDYVTTDMPNIPNTTPYGIVVFYDNSKESQKAVKDIMKQFYKSGDISKTYLLSEGFTPTVSFVKMDSELAKAYKNSIGKNVAEIVTTFTEGEQKGYADKTQLTKLSAPSLIFYTNTGQLVSATKMTDVNGKYQKVVASNAKTLYQQILAMNNTISNESATPSSDTTESSTASTSEGQSE